MSPKQHFSLMLAVFLSFTISSLSRAEVKIPGALASVTHSVITADSNKIDYDVWVWTPLSYDPETQAYPLMVLLDGYMLMGTAVEAVNLQNITGEAKPVIVVGVSTAPPLDHGVQRSIDYSADVPSLETPPGGEFSFWAFFKYYFESSGIQFEEGFGGTDEFYGFLADQLLPQLQGKYAIDPAEIGIAGHSSGGDFVVDTLLRKQTPFSKFIVGSYGADVLAARLPQREKDFAALSVPRPLTVFAGYGVAEIEDPALTHYIQSGIDLLERLGASDPNNVSMEIRGFDKENHGSVFHHVLGSGIREMWSTGAKMSDMLNPTLLPAGN
ncbi:MAG: alpha/beta hydrolase-fold protein [Pseudomonadota bacterium]